MSYKRKQKSEMHGGVLPGRFIFHVKYIILGVLPLPRLDVFKALCRRCLHIHNGDENEAKIKSGTKGGFVRVLGPRFGKYSVPQCFITEIKKNDNSSFHLRELYVYFDICHTTSGFTVN